MLERFFRLSFRCWAACALTCWSAAQSAVGQELSDEAIPLQLESDEIPLGDLAEADWLAGSARRALGAGLYDVAYALGNRVEALRGEAGFQVSNGIVIIDSLLARGNWIEARARLDSLATRERANRSSINLRYGMIAYAEGDAQEAGRLIDPIDPETLAAGDAAWHAFLTAWIELENGSRERALSGFNAARRIAASQSPALAAQIGYLMFRSLLESRTAGAATIPQLQNALLENREREVRFVYAQQLAVLLFDSGQVEEAIGLIEENKKALPAELVRERAQFQLLAVMAAGVERLEGRQALSELVLANRFPDLMSIALQQVFTQARLESSAGSEVIRSVLDQMISASPEHSLLDQALYYRAVFRFQEGDYPGAEDDAAELQRRFPTSPYRRGMLALQASSAWNRFRYRTAANRLQQMRSEFVDLQADYRLSALIADCYLRAGQQSKTRDDYRNAAEAYAAALSNVRSTAQGGPLFFQLIFSRIEAGQLELALQAIDSPELRILAGDEVIWKTQWLALREMRRVGRVYDAYDRVRDAVEEESLDPLLKLRLLWMAARLSVVSGDSEYTVDWVEQIGQLVEEAALAGADQDLLNRVRASSLLSLSEAHFALDEPAEAIALLERLRQEYAGYESALLSYISQARYLSKVNRTVEAQQLLVSLADQYPQNRLAPVALFEAAHNAAQRGQDTYLDEATKLLQRIASDYPESDIVYQARLMQADLLRRLNKFGSAERIYEFLENEYADRPDRYYAQLSLADTLLAQADDDPAKFDLAISRLELLMDLPEAPLDLRVEAGHKLGVAWQSRGETQKATQVYWLLYDRYLLESAQIRQLYGKGRYWLARSLFELAELSQAEGKIDQAAMFYGAIIDHQLNGSDLAQARRGILVAPAEEN